jgi:hypothetical protein
MKRIEELCELLKQNGFKVAAIKLDPGMMDVGEVDTAIASWADYPANMKAWPVRIVKTKTTWEDRTGIPPILAVVL